MNLRICRSTWRLDVEVQRHGDRLDLLLPWTPNPAAELAALALELNSTELAEVAGILDPTRREGTHP